MYIIASYPSLEDKVQGVEVSLISQRQVLKSVLPEQAVVHILPPFPSSGDHGFAPTDWFSVRPVLGTWDDLRQFAGTYRTILDGIYNHVGHEHPILQEFWCDPAEDGVAHAFISETLPSSQLSPRGGSVFRKTRILGSNWQIWQTFSEAAVDIDLQNPTVEAEVQRHLKVLKKSGVFGVRLDGCAYYGHEVTSEQLHSEAGKRISRKVAGWANAQRLFTIAQLDADSTGSSYFQPVHGWNVFLIDYAFPSVLAYTLLSQKTGILLDHIGAMMRRDPNIVRPVRTHDGIYLLSKNTSDENKLEMLKEFADHSLNVKNRHERPYELNASMPYLCGLGVDDDLAWARVLMLTALTGCIPGVPYYYLPFLLSDVPEDRATDAIDSPRETNRLPLQSSFVEDFAKSSRAEQIQTCLLAISKIRERSPTLSWGAGFEATSIGSSGIKLEHRDFVCVCNFSTRDLIHLDGFERFSLAWSHQASASVVNPGGSIILLRS